MSWKIDTVDRYYYAEGRNSWTYVETTYYFDDETMDRREATRSIQIFTGQEYSLPDWAKGITQRRKNLESNKVW